MERYLDISGESGISGYETGANFIRVRFHDGGTYLYSYVRPGRRHVEHMKTLAAKGVGLNTYINEHVRGNYECRKE